MAIGFMCTIAPIAFADKSYWVHIKETGTWYRDMYRDAFWNILTFMADIINCIERAIKEILSWNVYSKLVDIDPSLSQTNVKSIALVIATVAVAFVGIFLILNGDKMHVKDTVKNILVSLCLIISFPALIGALDTFVFGSNTEKGYTQSYSASSEGATKEGTVRLLGDKVLAMEVYDNIASVKSNSQKYFSQSEEYKNNGSPRDIDINKLANQSEIDSKYVSSETNRSQKKFSELTMNNCVTLLGFSHEYAVLQHLKEAAYKPSEKIDVGLARLGRNAEPCTIGELEQKLIDALLNETYNGGAIKVRDSKNYSLAQKAKTFEEAVDAIKDDIVWQLNYEENTNIAAGNNSTVRTTKLRTIKDYKKMSWLEQAVKVDIWEPNDDERVYAYDYDFFSSFVDMFIIIICLIFALLKLARMMWEIGFMHIFAPLVIATDAHGSGRAKRAIQQLITTFAILVIVLISLNLYISLIGKLHEIENLIARWGLTLAGMYFVIDGSDFIVKMTGLDAGVKSGAAVLLGLRSAAGIAKGAAHTTASVATTGAHAANHIGGAAVGAAVGAGAGVVGGVAGGSDGRSSTGGRVAGGIIGGAAGSIDGAANGASEGARRGLTGLFRANSGGQGAGGSSGSGGSLTQSSAGGTAVTSSDISTSAASSDAGTTATPPPIMNTEASNGGDHGTDAPSSSSQADIGSSAANSDVETSAPVTTPSANSPADSGTVATPNESAPTSEREGTVFTRSFEKGRQGGRAIAQPINTHRERKEARPPLKERMSNRAADFFRGRYKDDDGNGGNS